MVNPLIGLIGGSGLYKMEALQDVREHVIETPFGAPSDPLVSGTIDGIPVVFLARHGKGHRLLPSEVPYRANIFALKQMGVRYILSFSAVGSLAEEMAPLDMVIPDQFIDLTKRRESTFFGGGAVAHVSMANPICSEVARALKDAVTQVSESHGPINLHPAGTYVCIEGPQFSSLAESNWYRSMGAQVIGMTNMPEAKLAREAQIAYATLAMVTDYDCWHPREANVNASMALMNLMKNAERAQQIAIAAVKKIHERQPCSEAHAALASSLVTSVDAMSEAMRNKVKVLMV